MTNLMQKSQFNNFLIKINGTCHRYSITLSYHFINHPLLSFQKEKTDSPQLQQVKDKVSMKNNGAFARNNLILITVLKVIIVVVHCGGKQ